MSRLMDEEIRARSVECDRHNGAVDLPPPLGPRSGGTIGAPGLCETCRGCEAIWTNGRGGGGHAGGYDLESPELSESQLL